MVVALILYGVCVSAVLVWCTTSRSPSVNYLPISMAKLDDLRRWRKDLVVVELHRRAMRAIPGALSVRADELAALLRWIPPRTTLVLCGTKEVASCREEIEMILLRLGVEVAYVCRTTDSWTAQPAGPACVFLL
jgi:hypothetical protein